jgi:hypothetical protein
MTDICTWNVLWAYCVGPGGAAQSCGGTTPPCCYKCGHHKMLKEPLQRAALDIALGAGVLDIALGAGLSRVCSKTLNTQDLIQDLIQEHKVPFI